MTDLGASAFFRQSSVAASLPRGSKLFGAAVFRVCHSEPVRKLGLQPKPNDRAAVGSLLPYGCGVPFAGKRVWLEEEEQGSGMTNARPPSQSLPLQKGGLKIVPHQQKTTPAAAAAGVVRCFMIWVGVK